MIAPTLYLVDHFGTFNRFTSHARLSPADAARGETVWLVPEGTTITPPPITEEGEVAVLRAGAWVVMPDLRGHIAYDKATGLGRVVEEPGTPTVTETLEAPPSPRHVWVADRWALPLANARAMCLAAVGAELAMRNAAGFAYHGNKFQIDDASQSRIAALAVLASVNDGSNWPDGFVFIAVDNTRVAFQPAEFLSFASAAALAVTKRRLNARMLKDRIIAAADSEALAAIDVTTGWD